MNPAATFRWLGVAGIELRLNDLVLLVDPYLTRIPIKQLLYGKVASDSPLVAKLIPRCDMVLVTHCHFDHFLDVPGILLNTGAVAIGSANTCQLLRLFNIPDSQIHEVKVGDCFSLGEFTVDVCRALHTPIPGVLPGKVDNLQKPPLSARQYRMDEMFCYRIEINGISILTDPGLAVKTGPCSNILMANPYFYSPQYRHMLRIIQPSTVIPIHWDDFFRPLSQPVRPNIQTPKLAIPPSLRVDLGRFRQTIKKIDPHVRVFVPEILKPYQLGDLL